MAYFGQSLKDIVNSSLRIINSFPPRYELEPGIYSVSNSGSCSVNKVSFEKKNLVFFRNEGTDRISKEINNFLTKKNDLFENGFKNNRGILIQGPTGSGKTSFLYSIAEELVDKGSLVLVCERPWLIEEAIDMIQMYSNEKNTMIILEDIDESLSEQGVYHLLQAMDGLTSRNNLIFMATTNDINTLPKKLLRPGRFDVKVELANPNLESRVDFFTKKIGKKNAKSISEKTDGFSYAELAEVVKCLNVFQEDESTVINRIIADRELGYSKSDHIQLEIAKKLS